MKILHIYLYHNKFLKEVNVKILKFKITNTRMSKHTIETVRFRRKKEYMILYKTNADN